MVVPREKWWLYWSRRRSSRGSSYSVIRASHHHTWVITFNARRGELFAVFRVFWSSHAQAASACLSRIRRTFRENTGNNSETAIELCRLFWGTFLHTLWLNHDFSRNHVPWNKSLKTWLKKLCSVWEWSQTIWVGAHQHFRWRRIRWPIFMQYVSWKGIGVPPANFPAKHRSLIFYQSISMLGTAWLTYKY